MVDPPVLSDDIKSVEVAGGRDAETYDETCDLDADITYRCKALRYEFLCTR